MIVLCVRAHDIVGGCGALTLANRSRLRRRRSMREGRREMMRILRRNRRIVVKRCGTILIILLIALVITAKCFLDAPQGDGAGTAFPRQTAMPFIFVFRGEILSASRFFVQVFATSCPQSGKIRSFFAVETRIRGVVTRNSEKYRESFPQIFPLYPQRRFCT